MSKIKKWGGLVTSAAGTTGTIPKFTANQTLGNSTISESGGDITFTGDFASYDGITTAGMGTNIIVAAPPTTTGLIAANVNFINFTPPLVAADYVIIVEVDVVTATTHSFSCNVTFTDSGGVARTVVMSGFSPIGTALTTGLITNVTGAGVYSLVAFLFSTDASGTAITLSTVGTFTTVTYTLGARLYRT